MKVTFVLAVLAALILAGCSFGGSCVDNDICSVDEQLRGGCDDCKPDFEPTDLDIYVRNNIASAADTLVEGTSGPDPYILNGVPYEVTLVFVSNPVSTAEVTLDLSTATLTFAFSDKVVTVMLDDDEGTLVFGGQSYAVAYDDDTRTLEVQTDDSIRSTVLDKSGRGSFFMAETTEAKFSVNGEISGALRSWDSYTFSDGLRLTAYNIKSEYPGGKVNEGSASFVIEKDILDERVIEYFYCVNNNGGAFNGRIPVEVWAFGDFGDQPIEEDQWVNFEDTVLWGNAQIIQTENGLRVYSVLENPEDDMRYCMGGSQVVPPSNFYRLSVGLDPYDTIAERDNDNNYGYLQIEGEPQHFPEWLVEYTIGNAQHLRSRSTTQDIHGLPDGGTYYEADYWDSALEHYFWTSVLVPNEPEDTQRFTDYLPSHYTKQRTAYGTAYVVIYDPWDWNGQQVRHAEVLFRGKDGIVFQSGFLINDDDFDIIDSPFFMEYLKRFALPPPSYGDDGCSLSGPFNCGAHLSGTMQNQEVTIALNTTLNEPVTALAICGPGLYEGTMTVDGESYDVTVDLRARIIEFEQRYTVALQYDSELSDSTMFYDGNLAIRGESVRVEFDEGARLLTLNDWPITQPDGDADTTDIELVVREVVPQSYAGGSVPAGETLQFSITCPKETQRCVSFRSPDGMSGGATCKQNIVLGVVAENPNLRQQEAGNAVVTVSNMAWMASAVNLN